MWEHVMTHLENDPLKLSTEVDWVIKYHMIEAYRERHDLAAHAPPRRAARPRLPRRHPGPVALLPARAARRGRAHRHRRGDRARRSITPPQTTRARLRGAFIKRAKERKRDYTVDWVHLKLNDQAQRTVLCKDPFKSRDDRVERLIASLCSRVAPRSDAVVPDRRGRAAARGARRAAARRGRPRSTGPERAYVLPQLTGPVAARRPRRGEHHRGRARARHRRLARRALEPRARRSGARRGPGHIIKGRYTSIQSDVGSTEEHLEALAEVESIDGMPVVVAALHSQLPAVAAAFKAAAARRRASRT